MLKYNAGNTWSKAGMRNSLSLPLGNEEHPNYAAQYGGFVPCEKATLISSRLQLHLSC